jgi:two-component system nitrogen regulation response regulator NtrX
LRERKEDIPALIDHFVAQVCSQNNWRPLKFTGGAVAAMQAYPWPGNIRELRNMVERLMLLSNGEEVDEVTVLSVVSPAGAHNMGNLGSGTLASRVEGFEREVILAELKRSGFHMTNAAKTLGLERSHLYKKAEQLGIDVKKERREE